MGLNADEKLQQEASKARDTSQALGVEDLLSFVIAAIRADSSDPKSVSQRSTASGS